MNAEKQNRLIAAENGRFLPKPFKVRRAVNCNKYKYTRPIIGGHFNNDYRFYTR